MKIMKSLDKNRDEVTCSGPLNCMCNKSHVTTSTESSKYPANEAAMNYLKDAVDRRPKDSRNANR